MLIFSEHTVAATRRHPLNLTVFIVLLAAIGFSTPVFSARVSGLYEAEAPVAGQDAAARTEAIREALRRVLLKVTGNRSVLDRAGVNDALKNASRYVEQYRYRLDDSAEIETRYLRVMFEPESIDRMLRGLSLPVWGVTRPAVMLWLGADNNGRRSLLSPDRDRDVFNELDKLSADRGLPLIYPLMDLQDQRALQVSDLWGGFESNIQNASGRYDADVILAGRMENLGGAWKGSWTLYQGGRSIAWDSRGARMTDAILSGMDDAVDQLASRYAPVMADQGLAGVSVQISGIDDLSAYARVMQYLQSLEVVDGLSLHSVSPGVTEYRVVTRGGQESLARAISLGNLLSPEAPASSMENAPADGSAVTQPLSDLPVLTYRLRQ